MNININGIEQSVSNFNTDILTIERNRLEKKIANMEYISDTERDAFIAITEELERRVVNNGETVNRQD